MNKRKRTKIKLIKRWICKNWACIPLDVRLQAIIHKDDGNFWIVLMDWWLKEIYHVESSM